VTVKAPKIVVIGAGSAVFGLGAMATLIRAERLQGAELALVDIDEPALETMTTLAEKMNAAWDAGMTIRSSSNRRDVLPGANFVIVSVQVGQRETVWEMDWQIPLRHGVRQPYAENGGPGGFAHAARNIGPVMEIVHDMEQACPDAWFINYTNPMMRICDAIACYSDVKVVGLCHQIFAGYGMIGVVLADYLGIEVPEGEISTHADPQIWPRLWRVAHQALEHVEVKAAGLNHFTWMLDLRDKRTGEDLYPLFAERWASFDPTFEPLTRRVYDAFGWFPIPGDEHLCEYLPWASDPITRPWEKYDISLYDWDLMDQLRGISHDDIAKMGDGRMTIAHLRDADSEGALEVIENVAGAGNHYHLAVNLPNRGHISNLPEGAIVEVPGLISGAGVQGVAVGSLPEPIAELLRREITAVRLCVDAAVLGDRQAALQCLLLDPVITDLDVAQQILDDYLETYREHLPQFWP